MHYVDLTPDGLFKSFIAPGASPPQSARPLTDEQFQMWSDLGPDAFLFPSDADAPIRVQAAPQWYVDVDADGAFKGFHNPDLTGRHPPASARPLTDEQYQDWLAAGADGYRFPVGAEEPRPHAPSAAEQLEDAQGRKVLELRNACALEIIGGCESDALGSTHTYPTTPTDQANLNASVVAAIIEGTPPDWSTPFWCADASGAWARVPHSGQQITQVGRDVKAHVVGHQNRLAQLTVQAKSATTVADVEEIVY